MSLAKDIMHEALARLRDNQRWLQGDKWRYSESASERKCWKEHHEANAKAIRKLHLYLTRV